MVGVGMLPKLTEQLKSGDHDMNRFVMVVVNEVKSSLAAAEAFPVCRPARRWLLTLMWVLCSCTAAIAAGPPTLVANFDDMTEGAGGAIFSDGGITFSNLDRRLSGGGNVFAIEMTTNSLPGMSLPNYMTFGGYSSGPGSSFGRFGSMSIGFSGLASAASMNIFGQPPPGPDQNTLTLEAFNAGTMVDSQSVVFSGPMSFELSVSGVFDSLQLVSAGATQAGTSFFGVDNVQITAVPEPGAFMLLGIGIGGLIIAVSRGLVMPRKVDWAAV